jgi:hypothetical protein
VNHSSKSPAGPSREEVASTNHSSKSATVPSHQETEAVPSIKEKASASHTSKAPASPSHEAASSPTDMPGDLDVEGNTQQVNTSNPCPIGIYDDMSCDLIVDSPAPPPFLIPTISTEEECDAEFRLQFYANVEKRLTESRQNSPNFQPLFKSKEEALEIIGVLNDWIEPASCKRKGVT